MIKKLLKYIFGDRKKRALIDEKRIKFRPVGFSDFYFERNGEMNSEPTVDTWFRCSAVDEASARRKYRNFKFGL
jgi:hypothetical protein